MIVSGSQDGLSKTLEAILGPGDPLLVHDPFYPGVEVVVSNSRLFFHPIISKIETKFLSLLFRIRIPSRHISFLLYRKN